jgi:FMN-dependent NADH-azoreductase
MPKLFHLICSPRDDAVSTEAGRVFIDSFRRARPTYEIDTFDVWRENLPEFSGAGVSAKYARNASRPFNADEQQAFAEIERLAVRFALADRVLVTVPMWNFGIPYKAKQWLDLIIQPGLAFKFDPASGYHPLFKDRPTIVVVASGSDFVTGMNRGRIDMVTPYLREVFKFIGIRDLHFVPIGPTAGPPEPARLAREAAHRRLIGMASSF